MLPSHFVTKYSFKVLRDTRLTGQAGQHWSRAVFSAHSQAPAYTARPWIQG